MFTAKFWNRLPFWVHALISLVLASVAVYLGLRYAAEIDPFLRTVNLFGTMMHEAAGHSLVTLVTGGSVTEFVINPDGSGFANIGGGNFSLSYPAGYLSTTLLTALFFVLNNRTEWGDILPFFFSIVYAVLTTVYGAKLSGGLTTYLVGYSSAIFLFVVGLHPRWRIPFTKIVVDLPDFTWMFFVNVISLYYALGGILSLEYLSRHAKIGNIDDVSRFTEMFYPWMDPRTMASIWMVLSIIIWIAFALILSRFFRRFFKRKVNK